MPPIIATFVFVAGILGLFWLNKDRHAQTSPALWIPVIWLSLCGSRVASQWLAIMGLGGLTGGSVDSPDQYLDGSPIDRFFLTGLLIVGIVVLARRGSRVTDVLLSNWPILLFFAYCAMSTIWSDFPDIALKRWIKSLGDVTMVMLVLTDPDPEAAFQRFLSRVGFLLMPLSVLFIKYYPEIGKGYDRWTGTPIYTGVTYSKNILGMVCLILGLGALWRVSKLLKSKRRWYENRPLLAQGTLLLIVLWLLSKAGSATSLSCFALGGILLLLANRPRMTRRPALLHSTVAVMLSIPIAALFLNVGSGLVQTLGRDPTLTGRTEVWQRVLGMTTNPLIGTGFESFWLGKRLEALWQVYWWKPTEAHNGYIEIFLNLGWIGLILLAFVIGTGYGRIMRGIRRQDNEANLRLAFLFIAVAYNFTEAAFKTLHPVWITMLLSILAVPKMRVSGMDTAQVSSDMSAIGMDDVPAAGSVNAHPVRALGGANERPGNSGVASNDDLNDAPNDRLAWHSTR